MVCLHLLCLLFADYKLNEREGFNLLTPQAGSVQKNMLI